MSGSGLVVIGRIGRPHGVQGELRVTPTGPTLAGLRAGATVVVAGPGDGGPRELVLESIRPSDRVMLVRIAGIADREDAAALTGAVLQVPESGLPPLAAPDEFYVRDLIGSRVIVGGNDLGTVVEVYDGAANDALVVRRSGPDDLLIPFTADAVLDLDLAARTITIRDDLLGGDDA